MQVSCPLMLLRACSGLGHLECFQSTYKTMLCVLCALVGQSSIIFIHYSEGFFYTWLLEGLLSANSLSASLALSWHTSHLSLMALTVLPARFSHCTTLWWPFPCPLLPPLPCLFFQNFVPFILLLSCTASSI